VKYFLKIGFKNKIEEVGSYAMVSLLFNWFMYAFHLGKGGTRKENLLTIKNNYYIINLKTSIPQSLRINYS
jgi:hypothetical protein